MKVIQSTQHSHIIYIPECPGCKQLHQIHVERPNEIGARWSFNGNYDKPTISPSFLTWIDEMDYRCHFFLRDGIISFCSDSKHSMAGKKVELPEVPEDSFIHGF